jgi:hypothetical protein
MDEQKSCQINLDSEREIVQHIRDLINLTNLLGQEGFDAEYVKFANQLKEKGWGKQNIKTFLERACIGTRFEQIVNMYGDRIVPAAIPEVGDRKEYETNKYRWKK